MKKIISLISTLMLIIVISGCTTPTTNGNGNNNDNAEVCLGCPQLAPHSHLDQIWSQCGYVYTEFEFEYDLGEAMQTCEDNNYEGDECYGITYRICLDEFVSQNNKQPSYCMLIQVFPDGYTNNIACGCWYEIEA